jgi:hypothetical protein
VDLNQQYTMPFHCFPSLCALSLRHTRLYQNHFQNIQFYFVKFTRHYEAALHNIETFFHSSIATNSGLASTTVTFRDSTDAVKIAFVEIPKFKDARIPISGM